MKNIISFINLVKFKRLNKELSILKNNKNYVINVSNENNMTDILNQIIQIFD
jgi:hypothetical protein